MGPHEFSTLLTRLRELRDYLADPYKTTPSHDWPQILSEGIEALSAMAADEPLAASRLQCATLQDDLATAREEALVFRKTLATVAKPATSAPTYPDLSAELSTAHENLRLTLRVIVMMGGLIDLGDAPP